jgi:hypothetical protein
MGKRPIIAAAIAAVTIMGFSGTALAGEWAPGRGTTPIKSQQTETAPAGPARSICAFNGADQPDDGDMPEEHLEGPGDDADWEMTPAGGRVQSGGQFVAMFANFGPGSVSGAVASGEFGGFGGECNPNSGYQEP